MLISMKTVPAAVGPFKGHQCPAWHPTRRVSALDPIEAFRAERPGTVFPSAVRPPDSKQQRPFRGIWAPFATNPLPFI
jgi:hypothetical protein